MMLSNSPYSPASTIYSPSDSSVSMSSTLPAAHQPRQRLRPWLIDQINSGKIPGLIWLDKEKMIFRIPWKHFGRPGVDEYTDAMLFRLWAKHTKKYQDGEQPDISTWKTRFRCALHKLPDIDELNDLNRTEGDDPYRVYQFKKKEIGNKIDASGSPYPPSVNSPVNLSHVKTEVLGSPYTPASVNSPLSLPQHENPVVFSPMSSFLDMKGEYGGSMQDPGYSQLHDDVDPVQLIQEGGLDLPNIDGIDDIDEDLNLMNNILHNEFTNNIVAASPQTSISSPSSPFLSQLQHHMQQQQQHHQQQQQQQQESSMQMQQMSVSSLLIKLFFKNRVVGEKIVDNPRGLRVAFNPPPPLPEDVVKEDTSEVVSHIFGPYLAEQIYFPSSQDAKTSDILECTKRGLVLQERRGEILATRLCRAKVFYSDSLSPTEPVKDLPREHTTVIFDYANDFLPRLRMYMYGQGTRPTCERFFSFGQKWSNTAPLNDNFVYVSVTHCLAQKQLMQINKSDTPILISDPNMLDIIAKQIEEISFTNKSNNARKYEEGNMME